MSNNKEKPIGIFDSGVGGLTIALEIMRKLPNENIVYFGDTARVPYGTKSKETIIHYSRQIVKFLKEKNVKAIVVACNTASAFALDTIEKELDIPIIGVVKPGAKASTQITESKKVGVIGTEGTIKSKIYSEYIKTLDPEIEVIGSACPLFVPLVEEGWTHDMITEEVAERYLEEMKASGVDSLILGCTHYPLLRTLLKKVLGDSITLVNPAYETALSLDELLRENDIASDGDKGTFDIYVSDDPEKFKKFAKKSMKEYADRVDEVTQINIEEY